MPRRICLVCGGKLEKLESKDRKWGYLQKRSYYNCDKCKRRWLYSPNLTCPVLLSKKRETEGASPPAS